MSRRLLTALLIAVPSPLYAQAFTPTETAEVDRLVDRALADTGVPSASVAVVRGGRIVFAKAYGRASPTIADATPNLPYQIASISKQFTAAAVLLLRDEGKLKLDDTVSQYVPDITGGDRITIRELLSHTSGLQDYWPQDYSFAAMAKPVSPQGIVDRWARKPLDFAPGTQWQYSNTGYVVAGLIVEKVSGEPLLTFLRRRIFRPLGIVAYDQDKAQGPRFPAGYGRYALGPVRTETPSAAGWLYAAGELSMSATDLAKWDIARLDRKILPAADWVEQETPIRLNDGKSTGYGLGVTIGSKDGRDTIEHGGEAVGFLSENIVYPKLDAAVVVLTNAWFSDAVRRITDGIVKIALPPPGGDAADQAALTRARTVYAELQSGTLERARLTADANYYFTPTALADYARSLGVLGEPNSFTQRGDARLRGGFVNRNYRIAYPNRTLSLSTYAEPGPDGRFEQFLVAPAE